MINKNRNIFDYTVSEYQFIHLCLQGIIAYEVKEFYIEAICFVKFQKWTWKVSTKLLSPDDEVNEKDLFWLL